MLSGLLFISLSWAVAVTERYSRNSLYIEIGKQVVFSAKNIDDTLNNCGNDKACISMKRDMGVKVIDSMVKLAHKSDN